MSTYPTNLNFIYERNQDATIYVGNVDQKCQEEVLWELFTQCGPVVNVYLPRDRITGQHPGYAFIEFKTEVDAEYAIKIMHMQKLYNRPLKVNRSTQDKNTQEIGANIFVGNLADDVDEKILKDIFATFGVVLSTKIMRDPDTGLSKHYGFVSFDNFESSDKAIQKMKGQYISGKPIEVEYAFKKDTKGERHGSVAERILAANRPVNIMRNDEEEDSENYTYEDLPNREGKKKIKTTDYTKLAKAIGAITSRGISVSLIDINQSGFSFEPDEDNHEILFGLKGD